ncbi:MAG: hypothetical protein LBL66_07185 [Clostridiales bacterium]|nr:hypothetical protein [Clostridiales bacterium]
MKIQKQTTPFKKWVAAVMTVCVFAAVSLAGCRIPVGDDIDPTKTQVYVMNMYGGLRDNWLQDVKTRFETAYAETSCEQGKKGVQVQIDNTGYTGTNLLVNMADLPNEVFFTEGVFYYQFIQRNFFADITDMVREPLAAYGEERSIEDKLSADNKEYFETGDGKYFALPFYEAYSSIAYDIDLFEEKSFYLAKNGAPSEALQQGGVFTAYKFTAFGDKSAGPDGVYGTGDDGLPATYDEFFAMCDKMAEGGVRPIVWPGGHQDYLNEMATMLAADYEGAEKMKVNYTLNGDGVDIVTFFSGDTPVTTPVDIRNGNGYLMYNQPGRYYALDFVKRIVSGGYYDPDSFSSATTQMNAQEDFLYGRFSSKKRKVAMIADGTWWQNEASDIYSLMEEQYGPDASKSARRIGLMPLPKATAGKIGSEPVYLTTKHCAGFVNATATGDKLAVAKKFLQFVHTDESLARFTQIVNMPKPYNYDMTEAQLAEMTLYGRALYEAHAAGNVVCSYSTNPIFLSSPSDFAASNCWNTQTPYGPYKIISNAFYNESRLTARAYFDGLLTAHSQSAWQTLYGGYFSYNA